MERVAQAAWFEEFGVIKSYWIRLLIFTLAGGALALGVSLVVPKKYEGIVQILIDQKAVLPNIPTSGADASVTDLLDFSRSRGITTQVQQLTSITVLTEAAVATASELSIPLATDARGIPVEGEFSYDEVAQNIAIEAEVGSDLVTVRVRMSDPERAQAMARNIYAAFDSFNRRTTETLAGQAIASLESQMKGVKDRLADIDDRTLALRTKLNTPSLESQMTADISSIARIKDQRDLAAIDLASARGRLTVVRQSLANVSPTITASKTEGFNQNFYTFDQTLATLRSDLALLEERYLPDHELVKAQREKIRRTEDERAKQMARIDASSTTTPNPLYQSLQSQLSDSKASVNALEERLQRADQAVIAAEKTLLSYPDAQKGLVELAREQMSLERTYASYADRLQSLELAGQGRTAPTRMAGAGGPLEAVSPKPTINALVGLLLGLVLGVMSMLRTESSRQPVRSIMQLNLLSSEPVFKALPEMRAPYRGLERSPPEAFEGLVAGALRSGKTPYRVGFVGVLRDSGTSTAALNYALSASRRGLECLLVSLDPRSPNGKRVGVKDASGTTRVNDNLGFMQIAEGSLMVGTRGKSGLNESVTSQERDVTVFDFEATTESADYAFTATQLDEVVLLVRANRVNSVDFLAVNQALKDSGCPVITIVLARGTENDALADAPDPEETRALPS